jgi:hypothetical protein
MTEQQALDKADEIAEKAEADGLQFADDSLGGLPKEPIPAETYTTFCHLLGQVIDKLTGGQVPFTSVEATKPVKAFEPETARAILGMHKLLTTLPEGQPYEFDPTVALADEAGIVELGVTLTRAMKDKALVAAATKPAPDQPAAPAPVAAPKKEKKASKPEDFGGSDAGY